MNLIYDATRFAYKAHLGQVRKYTGVPYIIHPTRVALRASIFIPRNSNPIIDSCVVAAAWLHDVIEDCGVQYSELHLQFGGTIANLVKELTNVSKADKTLNRAGRKAADIDRVSRISNEAKQLKLCDRLDNLEDIFAESKIHGQALTFLTKCYYKESKQLMDVLRGVNPLLEEKIDTLLGEINNTFWLE